MDGLLIAICGLDGSGKTTQITNLANWFKEQEMNYLVTKQPTDTYRNDSRVRAYLDNGECPDMEILAMLSAADRKWHLKTEIEPLLEKGTHVISDRYLYSAIAFFNARGLDVNFIKQLNQDTREPDLIIFIDVEPSISLKRISIRDDNKLKFEERSEDIFIKVRDAFLKYALPKKTIIIDGTLDPSIIHEKIRNEVEYILKRKEGITIES